MAANHGAYLGAGRLHQQQWYQLLQNNPMDSLSGQKFPSDNLHDLPEDKPATILTSDSKTATEMAWAHPQETKC